MYPLRGFRFTWLFMDQWVGCSNVCVALHLQGWGVTLTTVAETVVLELVNLRSLKFPTKNSSKLQQITYCNIALVLMDGSSGLKCLYWSTSFSRARSCFWSLSLRPGRVSRMWLVSCWFNTRCRYGVPSRSAKCLYDGWLLTKIVF